MLNKNSERELAYLVRIDTVNPIPNYDRIEVAMVGGWSIVCGKGEFKAGDLGVYFEIDSLLPAVKPFCDMAFLVDKKYRIKTQAMCKGTIHSQGLLVPIDAFEGWQVIDENTILIDKELHCIDDESRFLTKLLKVVYYEPEDNFRKSNGKQKDAKYMSMCSRHQKLAKKKWWRWLMKRSWGRKLLFVFFGKKKDKPNDWPSWVKKTDEERCQNMPFLFTESPKVKWIATEKIDGTSTTFTMKNDKKRNMLVCSRNVVFNKPDKQCFYDTNVYLEMAQKYEIEKVLNYFLNTHKDYEFVTIQGETYGGNIQKRNYGDEHRLAVFNFIYKNKNQPDKVRLNPIEMENIISDLNKNCDTEVKLEIVPIVDTEFYLPDTCAELIEIAHGNSKIDGQLREGLVFRNEDATISFKAVDPIFLEKYHND